MMPSHIRPLPEMDSAWREVSAGERLQAVRLAAPSLRERILESGKVSGVRTFVIASFPYPTRFGLAGLASPPLPYLVLTNRVNVVQFETEAGELKLLLFNPTDYERSAETPFFQAFRKKFGYLAERMAHKKRPKTPDHLATLGLSPEDVDYIAFDHMHTQDVREMLGTTAPALGQQTPLRAIYPRAKLLIWKPELDIFRQLHPLQRYWYIEDGIRHVPADRFLAVDQDILLGKGVALVRTPGHTVGNWSLVINTEGGVWAVSENGIACDAYAPESSAIRGLKKHTHATGEELVLNSNTLEGRNEQYTSMVLEKLLVDRCTSSPEFYQHFPSSELTASPLSPGLSPTYSHGTITSGQVRRQIPAGRTQAA
ncbi:MAG TPA: hypothetical protein VKN99_02990 [Polyangia bacterium]|nr:hypothetical protein [Polyangia bacterium]